MAASTGASTEPMTPTVSDPRITEDSYVSLPMQPGDVVAFSSFLVHRTGETGDGQVRIAFSTRYNNAEEPTYVLLNKTIKNINQHPTRLIFGR